MWRLLHRGANINAIANPSYDPYGTALIAAVSQGWKTRDVELLLDQGADINAVASGHKYPTVLIALIMLRAQWAESGWGEDHY